MASERKKARKVELVRSKDRIRAPSKLEWGYLPAWLLMFCVIIIIVIIIIIVWLSIRIRQNDEESWSPHSQVSFGAGMTNFIIAQLPESSWSGRVNSARLVSRSRESQEHAHSFAFVSFFSSILVESGNETRTHIQYQMIHWISVSGENFEVSEPAREGWKFE